MNAWAVRLHDAIAGLAPIDGVSVNADHSVVRIDFKAEATQQQRDAATAAAIAFDWSDAAQLAWDDANQVEAGKDGIDLTADASSGSDAQTRVIRALAIVTMDELNILRGLWMSFKGEVAAATSLADLKARVAGLPDTPDRTAAQLRNAIQGKLDENA